MSWGDDMDWGGHKDKEPPVWLLWVVVIITTIVLIFIFMD